MNNTLPLPVHYRPKKVSEVWKVDYQTVAANAENWRREHQLHSASQDEFRVCLVAVDVQNTFCIPEFELYVGGRSGTGAVDDNRRLCEFIYKNLNAITRIVPTMDTHQAMQIFHSVFLIDADGRHPESYTLVSTDDIKSGKWTFNAALSQSLNMSADDAQRHLLHYANQLESSGKYALTIWPYHAMLGGIGHALVSAFEEAMFFHTLARYSQPAIQVKGNHPLTEHYSVFGPEVSSDTDGNILVGKNEALFKLLRNFDAVIIAGQAKSHCVAWTIADLLNNVMAQDHSLVEKVYLLEDCTSPVVIPDVIDYTDDANAAFQRFADAGMHLVHSTDPMTSWPGLGLSMA